MTRPCWLVVARGTGCAGAGRVGDVGDLGQGKVGVLGIGEFVKGRGVARIVA